jgi:hypothetical protein
LIEVLAILLELLAILTGEAKTNELEAEVSLPTKLQFTLPVLEDPLELLELLEFKLELSGEFPIDFKDL